MAIFKCSDISLNINGLSFIHCVIEGKGFNNTSSIYDAMNTAIEKSNSLEICCTDRMLGNIGLLLKGVVVCGFNEDSYTYKDNHGGRLYDDFFEPLSKEEIISLHDAMIFGKCLNRQYPEIIVKDYKVEAILYSEDLEPEELNVLKDISKFHGIKMIAVASENCNHLDKKPVVVVDINNDNDWLEF